MDLIALVYPYSVPLAVLVFFGGTWAALRHLILAHHFNALTGATFAALAYLAATHGNWAGAALYTVIAAFDMRRYLRLRPRPLDGSHEAL